MKGLLCPNCGAPVHEAAPGAALNCTYCHVLIERAKPPAPPPQPRVENESRRSRHHRHQGNHDEVEDHGSGHGGLTAVLLVFAVGITAFVVHAHENASAAVNAAASTTTPSTAKVSPAAVAANPNIEHSAVTLTWNAKVTSAVGMPLAAGTSCLLTTRAIRSNKGYYMNDQNVQFTCAGRTLYDSSDTLAGASNDQFALTEYAAAGEAHAYNYVLKSSDVGSRSGARSQITVNTKDGAIEVFRENAPVFHVVASVDDLSAIRRGLPAYEGNIPPFPNVVTRIATVTDKSGPVPFTTSSCELKVSPAHSSASQNPKLTCRVLLTCGGKVLFGTHTAGFEECALDANGPVSFDDQLPTPKDNDPEFEANLHLGTATLGDVLPGGAVYSVNFRLNAAK